MPPFSGMRCLVVDDEPRLRRVLIRLLEGEGFVCREAGSGVEALALLEQEPVPLLISDLRMPEMDGVTLLREVTARWPETGVIVVTAGAVARGGGRLHARSRDARVALRGEQRPRLGARQRSRGHDRPGCRAA